MEEIKFNEYIVDGKKYELDDEGRKYMEDSSGFLLFKILEHTKKWMKDNADIKEIPCDKKPIFEAVSMCKFIFDKYNKDFTKIPAAALCVIYLQLYNIRENNKDIFQ